MLPAMTTPNQIVRCIKRDMSGDLAAGARYCEEIAANARMNPWASPEDASNYTEAAKLLRREIELQAHIETCTL